MKSNHQTTKHLSKHLLHLSRICLLSVFHIREESVMLMSTTKRPNIVTVELSASLTATSEFHYSGEKKKKKAKFTRKELFSQDIPTGSCSSICKFSKKQQSLAGQLLQKHLIGTAGFQSVLSEVHSQDLHISGF